MEMEQHDKRDPFSKEEDRRKLLSSSGEISRNYQRSVSHLTPLFKLIGVPISREISVDFSIANCFSSGCKRRRF
jgi:hypothetical protein